MSNQNPFTNPSQPMPPYNPPQQPYDPRGYATAQPKQHQGSAVTSLVAGIIGSVMGLIPILSIISFPAAVVAIVCGLIARKRAMGKWGIALGVLALVLAIISFVIVQKALSDFGHCTDAVSNDLQNSTDTADAACN